MEVLVDDKWILERMEMNYNREWYLIGKPYCGNRETILWKSGIGWQSARKLLIDGRMSKVLLYYYF